MQRKILVGLGLTVLLTLLAPEVQSQTYQVFPPGNGKNPQAGVTIKGDFVYGTAAAGGLGGGAVYEIKHLGNLISLSGSSPGPEARVVFGPDGHLYGTSDAVGVGFVFVLTPQPTICKVVQCQPWKAETIHSFQFPDATDPSHADLVWDQQGNIYGTGMTGGGGDLGAVYELMPPIPPSKTWTEKVIWNFSGDADGAAPQGGVIFDANGNLVGTAQGGPTGLGTVFKLTPAGDQWVESNIYNFRDAEDGYLPIAGLLMDGAGNLYGSASDNGDGGGGTVFELTPSGDTYTFKLLYSFTGKPLGECGPRATLTMDVAGNLYGTTYCDGAFGRGNVFKLTRDGDNWVYSSLHDFPAFSGDIQYPASNVSIDANGNLWGTASAGGSNGSGGVWMITP